MVGANSEARRFQRTAHLLSPLFVRSLDSYLAILLPTYKTSIYDFSLYRPELFTPRARLCTLQVAILLPPSVSIPKLSWIANRDSTLRKILHARVHSCPKFIAISKQPRRIPPSLRNLRLFFFQNLLQLLREFLKPKDDAFSLIFRPHFSRPRYQIRAAYKAELLACEISRSDLRFSI